MTIAGSDSSGGAGIQADLNTFAAFGCYGTSAVTCVVAENPLRVISMQPIPRDKVRAQIDAIFEVFPVAAMKTGMLFSASIMEQLHAAITEIPEKKRPPLVIDPVIVSSSGTLLIRPRAIRQLGKLLLPMATLTTPNVPEAEALLAHEIKTEKQARDASRQLYETYGSPFLIKGGHLKGSLAKDFLFDGSELNTFEAPRIRNIRAHGTGCTLSAAICACLGKGMPLNTAIHEAKKFLTGSLTHHLKLGKFKALNHLHTTHTPHQTT